MSFRELPELPQPLIVPTGLEDSRIQPASLRAGCWLLRYTPQPVTSDDNTHFDGTLRIQREGTVTIISGDLYVHLPVVRPEPSPSAGVPIFPIGDFRHYLRATGLVVDPDNPVNALTLDLEFHRFRVDTKKFALDGKYTASLTRGTAPTDFVSPSDYYSGPVAKSDTGRLAGTLTMGWVSPYLRAAVIEIDTQQGIEPPLNNGRDKSWATIFADVGWQMSLITGDRDIAPLGRPWSSGELHSRMIRQRDQQPNLLDKEWRYHVLCVELILGTSRPTTRGKMYDNALDDANGIPREGVAVAASDRFDDTEFAEIGEPGTWGGVAGQLLGAVSAAYFRTAAHEIGHAMGLAHNRHNRHFMDTSESIASQATSSAPFPENILWTFEPSDGQRLRHHPDIAVRPGGLVFSNPLGTAELEDRASRPTELRFEVNTFQDVVPLGAPVRVTYTLSNVSNVTRLVPGSLSFSEGFVHGFVTDPSGTVRGFMPLQPCADRNYIASLAPKHTKIYDATLMRGPQGALFPMPGIYRITIRVMWEISKQTYYVEGATSVMVLGAQAAEHASIALAVLCSAEVALALIVGGDHLEEGLNLIDGALLVSELRPHFAAIKARRMATPFFARSANFDEAANLLDSSNGQEVLVTGAELLRIAQAVANAQRLSKVEDAASPAGLNRLAEIILAKSAAIGVNDAVTELLG